MSKHIYRHTVTKVEAELDDNFVSLIPGAFEIVEEKKAAEKAPVKKTVEPAPAATKKNDSSKEGNN